MKNLVSCAAMAAMLALACNAGVASAAKTTRKSFTGNATAGKKTSSSSAKKGTSKKTASTNARKSGARSSAHGKKAAPVNRTTWRNRQMAPSSDRYREIQSALAARGYLKEEDATGSWNQASAEAMKKFQAEQNLDASGKINSLSLIALGLGPRRDAVAAVPKTSPSPDFGQ